MLDFFGGNRAFYDFLCQYNLQDEPLKDKYNSYPVWFYGRRLNAKVSGATFDETEPRDDWRDTALYTVGKAKEGLYQAGQKISGAGHSLAEKLKNFFTFHSSTSPPVDIQSK